MAEYTSGAYFIRRKKGGRGKGAALLVLVLLLLTTGIVLLAVFLPRHSEETTTDSAGGKNLYFLVSGQESSFSAALIAAQDCASRGGAGYLFNDGMFRAVASVYENEADARDLAALNDGASYFMLTMPAISLGGGDAAAYEYVLGEFFGTLYTAATELDRGKVTDAAADYAVSAACRKLGALSASTENQRLKRALETASVYAPNEDSRSLLSYIRFVQVRATVEVYYALVG